MELGQFVPSVSLAPVMLVDAGTGLSFCLSAHLLKSEAACYSHNQNKQLYEQKW